MRFLVVLAALLGSGFAAAAQNNVRYFNGVYGLLDDVETDAFLKETRAGDKVVSAELDLCHALAPGSPLRDRVVVTLKPQGKRLIGTGQGQESKTPVTVDLVRSGSGDTFSFDGTVKYGDRTFKASSGDVTDMTAKEFQEQTAVEETITESPASFHEVTPSTIAFRVNRSALVDFLKALRSDNVKVQAYSIAPSCEALRRGYFDVQAEVDPERALDVIAKAKSHPGVTRAGWISGGIDLSRSIRFPAAEWRDASGKLDREKLGKTIAAVTAKALSAEQDTIEWDDITGELSVLVKRPDVTVPGLGLTEVIGAPFVFSSEKPGGKDTIVVRIGQLDSEIQDIGSGPRLQINTAQDDGDSSEPVGSDKLQAALAKELKGQVWDTDKETWAK
ncbi:hypothetical protein [Pseudorhodoplanes sinuspersici]|uniref:Uncharacterized protein n=1 Tax=Pseudorhodoplanes sinuspersici TaxID=1235591 RepID=A0A1W6ZRC8_9HYPH|nr:hypothetical protein [Pseudorhodoplanes sinuspersici]ARP99921.1 hypothetical protein CAK95_13125 [Pseudorhodoplanes sinuspersici]RKE70941.1 hypothetical protein DFP91_3193 [Pseudorhodoplanes sinuspersici]